MVVFAFAGQREEEDECSAAGGGGRGGLSHQVSPPLSCHLFSLPPTPLYSPWSEQQEQGNSPKEMSFLLSLGRKLKPKSPATFSLSSRLSPSIPLSLSRGSLRELSPAAVSFRAPQLPNSGLRPPSPSDSGLQPPTFGSSSRLLPDPAMAPALSASPPVPVGSRPTGWPRLLPRTSPALDLFISALLPTRLSSGCSQLGHAERPSPTPNCSSLRLQLEGFKVLSPQAAFSSNELDSLGGQTTSELKYPNEAE